MISFKIISYENWNPKFYASCDNIEFHNINYKPRFLGYHRQVCVKDELKIFTASMMCLGSLDRVKSKMILLKMILFIGR
jgi:hypothetical protein